MGEGSSHKSKKQKTSSVSVTVSNPSDSSLGPVFAVFPSATPSASIPFRLYSESGNPTKGNTVLVGETEEIEYASRNQLGVGNGGDSSGSITGEGEGYSTQYMLGVHNPRTNSLTLHAAPVHSITTNVQSLKSQSSLMSSGALASIQRAALGQAFGTRKAIRAQNAEVRNKLNQDSYGTSSQIGTLLQASIAISASSLPSTEGIEKEANLKRPIPPPNFDAKTPSEVYDLEDVVTGAELDAIDLEGILSVDSQKERNQFLPYRRSSYIALKMRHLLPAIPTDSTSSEMTAHTPTRKDALRIRLLVHLSHLLAFRQAIQGKSDATIDQARVQTKLGEDFPPFLLEQLLERYTEVLKIGEENRKSSTVMENKLLGYFLVLVLKIDGYGTDVGTIANDLGIGSKKVQELFRSLGCTIVTPSSAERDRLVTTGQATSLNEAKKAKRAVLRVPLEFPRETRGMPKR